MDELGILLLVWAELNLGHQFLKMIQNNSKSGFSDNKLKKQMNNAK